MTFQFMHVMHVFSGPNFGGDYYFGVPEAPVKHLVAYIVTLMPCGCPINFIPAFQQFLS